MPRRAPRRGEESEVEVENAVRSIDAKMKLLAQRLKIIEMNEQVIGRTLVSHNKKLKEIEAGGAEGPDLSALKADVLSSLKGEISDLKRELKKESMSHPSVLTIDEAGSSRGLPRETQDEIRNLKKAVSSIKQEVDELKYIVGSINPLEYVTVTELGDIIEKKLEKELGERNRI